jgi:hypothetical protein
MGPGSLGVGPILDLKTGVLGFGVSAGQRLTWHELTNFAPLWAKIGHSATTRIAYAFPYDLTAGSTL